MAFFITEPQKTPYIYYASNCTSESCFSTDLEPKTL